MTFDLYDSDKDFFISLEQGNLEHIQNLINAIPGLFNKTFRGHTFASYAIIQNNDKLTKLILKYADFEEKDLHGRTLLHNAVIVDNSRAVELLILNGANIEAVDNDGNKALFYAFDLRRDFIASRLLESFAQTENTNNGDDLLVRMIDSERCEDVELLLKYGANSKIQSKNGDSLIEIAYSTEDEACFTTLVENGFDTKGYFEKSIRDNKPHVFNTLLSYGADATIKIDDIPAIYYAVKNKYDIITKILIRVGINSDFIINDDSALRYAIRNKDKTSLEILLKGTDLKNTDSMGLTPLHYAVKENSINAVKLFIKNHADIEALTNKGSSPLNIAAEKSSLDILKYLVDSGANIKTLDNAGNSPIMNAIIGDREENIKYLFLI